VDRAELTRLEHAADRLDHLAERRGDRPRDDAEAVLFCQGKKLVCRGLIQDVVQDLERVSPAASDDLDPFSRRGDRYSPDADLPCLLELVHRLMDLVALELLDVRIVQLVKIDVVGAQPFEGAIDGVEQMLFREVLPVRPGSGAHVAELRGDDDVFARLREDQTEE